MSEFIRLGEVRGFKRALEVCERMIGKAPEPKRQVNSEGLPRCVDGSMCQGTGYVEVSYNVVRICECRRLAIEAARRREVEAEKPHKDVVDYLLGDNYEEEF